MKATFFSIFLLISLSFQAQESFKTSDFNWSPKTKTIQKIIYSINSDTNEKEWVRTETYFFYNTFLDSIVLDLGNAKEITSFKYNIDNLLISKITDIKISETQDKTLYFYNKNLQLIKSQDYVQKRLFSETKYTYDSKNRLLKSVCVEKETGFTDVTDYFNYSNDVSFTKKSYYKDRNKEANLSIEIFKNGLLIEGNYQIFDLKSKTICSYDQNRNITSEQINAETPTLYQYEYDLEGNPTKIVVSNVQNPYLNSEIIFKSTYSDFKTN